MILAQILRAKNHADFMYLLLYYPINQKQFNQSLITCHGIITGGGFETPAEALYLGKNILSIPIRNHYEQECNAAALKKNGSSCWV